MVVLSRTLQVVRQPSQVLHEMLRVGRQSLVSFPNFGYWRNRHQIAWTGRVPVSRNLPFSWADTPNLHFLSMKDFEKWCEDQGVAVLDRVGLDYESGVKITFWPNLRGHGRGLSGRPVGRVGALGGRYLASCKAGGCLVTLRGSFLKQEAGTRFPYADD